MRLCFSILLFLSLAVRPIMQFGAMTYYQLNMGEIIQKYCVNKTRPQLQCNGKCYLMKSKKSSDTSVTPKIMLSEIFIPLFFESSKIRIPSKVNVYDSQDAITRFLFLMPQNVFFSIDHPPEVVV